MLPSSSMMRFCEEIAEASALAADYRFLNREFPTAESMASFPSKPSRLEAHLA